MSTHAGSDAPRVDRVLYSPKRLLTIATEAAKPISAFSLDNRIGFVHDAMAFAKAGHLRAPAALALVHAWRGDDARLEWEGITDNIGILCGTWWEDDKVLAGMDKLRQVRVFLLPFQCAWD
jgi:aminopeptidase 2